MQTAGAQRARLSHTLTTAYGRGLLSEHTLAMRLESLLREHLVDPELLVGDLCLRRPEETLRGRLSQSMSAIWDRVGALWVDAEHVGGPMLLALDWSAGAAELLVGRSSGCDVVLSGANVSRRHARLRCHDGRWALEDLNSTNGTLINGRPVGRCELRPGDDLRLGSAHLRVD